MPPIFTTNHLIARKFQPEDARRLYENHLEKEMKQWIPDESYADPAEAESAVKFYSGCVDKKRLPYVLAVVLRETGELIGDTGVNEVSGRPHEMEIGYSICKKHSGHRYASELTAAMTDYIAKTFDARILYGRVMRGNEASVKVLEKNGYRFVREEFGAEDDPYGKGMLVYQKEC